MLRLILPWMIKRIKKALLFMEWGFLKVSRAGSQAGPRIAWESEEERLALGFIVEIGCRGGDSSYPWAKATVFWNLPVPKWVAGRLSCWLAYLWGTKVNRSGKAWNLPQTFYSRGSLISCRKSSIILSSDAASALFSLLFFWSCNYKYVRSFDCVPHVSMFCLFSFSSPLPLAVIFLLCFSLDIFYWYV